MRPSILELERGGTWFACQFRLPFHARLRSAIHTYSEELASNINGKASLPFALVLSPTNHSRECNVALSEYADLRCRTLTDMHLRERAAPAETFLRSEDPTAWEVALVGAPRDHQASKVVWEEGEESQEGANVRNGEAPGEQTMDALDSLHRIRAKLVSLRDAVWIGLNALEMQFDKAEEGLDLQDLQPLEFGQSQQSRRKNEELESEETRYSWTIHSQDGCRIEEVWLGEVGRTRLVLSFIS